MQTITLRLKLHQPTKAKQAVYRIDLVHLGVWAIFGLTIGVVTPPVGASLYIVSDIAKVPMERLIKRSLPYYIPLIVALLLVSFIPALSTFLPNLLAK